jgi:hypothetical protein
LVRIKTSHKYSGKREIYTEKIASGNGFRKNAEKKEHQINKPGSL